MKDTSRLTLALAVALLGVLGVVAMQHQHIKTLEATVQQLRTEMNQRTTNLEYIANAHTAQLKEIEQHLFHIDEAQAELDWRTKITAWKEDTSQ